MGNYEFTSKDIEKGLGLKVNTLHYYVTAGAIVPDIVQGEGTGHKRMFSRTNLIEAYLIMELIQYGLAKRSIVACLKSIKRHGDRNCLDVEKLGEQREWRYLIFYRSPKEPGGFRHRFVTDGGPKYRIKYRDKKRLFTVTSSQQVECLEDFLLMIDVCIVVNLSMILGQTLVVAFDMADMT